VSEWHDVGSVEELERAGHLVARIGGREVGVVRDSVGGHPVGVRNRCPHSGAPLCLGTVRQRVIGTPGHYALTGEPVLRCPWHGWEFDLETGRCRDDASMRVALYPAEVRDGRVRIQA
jgi:nitrite reductase (NADH) small subunit